MICQDTQVIFKVMCLERLRSPKVLHVKSKETKNRNGVSISFNMTAKCNVTHCVFVGGVKCKLTALLRD